MDTLQVEEMGIRSLFYLMGKSEDRQKSGILHLSDRSAGLVPQRRKPVLFSFWSAKKIPESWLCWHRKSEMHLLS